MISAGHRRDDILNYSLHQVGEFMAAIERGARRSRLGDAIAARMSQADRQTWKGYVRKLEGE